MRIPFTTHFPGFSGWASLWLLWLYGLPLFLSLPARAQHQGQSKPRLLVLTDISSLSQQEGEPDDGQSLIRLMLYTNELDLEGLIATSNLGHGQRTRPELIRQVVETYGQVQANLVRNDKNYPPASRLLPLIKSGQPLAGPKVPLQQSIGEGKDTEASEWIIRVVDKKDLRPVWVSIWGGAADLAQALWKVRATRQPGQVRQFVAKLRVHAIYDQDQAGPWLKEQFPDLFYIFRHHGIRGMYRGGDTTLVRSNWVESNIRKNHGPLGSLYVNYQGGDIWSRNLGRVRGIKEGDTPSFLHLLANGLNAPEQPEWGSWSGRFRKESKDSQLWVEATDSVASYQTDPDKRMAALYRWRPAWQADFAARLDWCNRPYHQANHAPRLEARTGFLQVRSGRPVQLRPPAATDPDRQGLRYTWFFYPEAGSFRGSVPDLSPQGKALFFRAPVVTQAQTLHLILGVTDKGEPALTTYKRYILEVKP